LHGGGQGFESPRLHSGKIVVCRGKAKSHKKLRLDFSLWYTSSTLMQLSSLIRKARAVKIRPRRGLRQTAKQPRRVGPRNASRNLRKGLRGDYVALAVKVNGT
jgi:hypothetical protein